MSISEDVARLRALTVDAPVGMVMGAKQELESLMGQVQSIMGDVTGLQDVLGAIQAATTELDTSIAIIQNVKETIDTVASRH